MKYLSRHVCDGNRLFVRPSLDDLASNMSQLIFDSSLTAFPKDVFRPAQRQPVRTTVGKSDEEKNLGTISNLPMILSPFKPYKQHPEPIRRDLKSLEPLISCLYVSAS